MKEAVERLVQFLQREEAKVEEVVDEDEIVQEV